MRDFFIFPQVLVDTPGNKEVINRFFVVFINDNFEGNILPTTVNI